MKNDSVIVYFRNQWRVRPCGAQKGMKKTKMQKLEQLYEGKAKKVFRTDDPELYIVDYKDDATAFNGQKKGTIASKGVVNNKMSAIIFQQLEENGVPTHLVRFSATERPW